MATFDQLWNAEFTQPIQSGAYDPQGANAWGVPASTFNTNLQLPSLSSGGGDGPSSAITAPAAATSQPMTQADCAWYDVVCKYQNFQSPTLSSVFTGMGNGPGGATNTGTSTSELLGTLTGVSSSDAASYFNRAVVIILGFIFVAAGLYMFKSNVANIIRQ